ncbi:MULTISPECIES: nucleotidyltransferase domain-containing protein [unclassified Microbacterium]|uniref:nucleotidyltransferase domain-containing protein n=1 Tax=unclassified Microbacterium TaxID=2609290 RepID=UPI00214D0B1C|nr:MULTISPECIES: nucleotidyltransferase domain-containing protein [unclassified Microbacterium]MCR2784539.1 nucleotidyltransferase domain-containing protein [Microbacterium sp. zg.B96]MDL5350540.1 nucleotidyltransferase domain-containing protein [Microbacterium sp. zg-YB36]WIM14650.1 nucleotidyltransferase domain-containing protein [Microbacterium sp. zg-B96]
MFDDDRLRAMAYELAAVPGVRAVALGGSRARGTHRPDSDVDLGLYVTADVDRDGIAAVARDWMGAPVTVSPRGGWGPWVDSGAWLVVDGIQVDLILRDVDRVAEQCARAARGEYAFHAQPGHPLGFLDIAYAGEVATCQPLSDEGGLLAAWAARLTPYPAPLRDALLRNLWQVDFLLDGATKGARQADAGYVALCASTAAMLLAHGWHAAAGVWVTNEKGLIPNAARLALDSRGFSARAASVLGALGSTSDELQRSIAELRELPRP